MLQRLYYQSATYLPCGLVKSSVLSLLWGEKEEVRRGDRGQEGTGGTLGQGGLLSQTLPATIRTTMACRCNMPATWPCWVVPPCHLPQGQDLEVLARLMTRQYLAVQSTGDTNVIYSN